MDNLLRKMQDDQIGFDIKIDEVNEREIDDDKYYQREIHIEQQERAHLEFWAEMHEERGIRKYEALSAEELLQDEENVRKYEIALSTAEKLLAEDADLDYIEKVTGWSVNQIKALQYQMQKDLVSAAKKLLAENVDLDYIAKATKLKVFEIKALQYQMQKVLAKVLAAS